MKTQQTKLPGLIIIECARFADQRGAFLESYHIDRYQKSGLTAPFVQDNQSLSKQGVVRGLHYQLPHAQGKLVWAAWGHVLDVVVDLRQQSSTFGESFSIELSSDNGKQLYVPPGFAHGFSVLSEQAVFNYKCTDYYHQQSERGIHWQDPQLNIDWQVEQAIVSDKDQALPTLADIDKQWLPA